MEASKHPFRVLTLQIHDEKYTNDLTFVTAFKYLLTVAKEYLFSQSVLFHFSVSIKTHWHMDRPTRARLAPREAKRRPLFLSSSRWPTQARTNQITPATPRGGVSAHPSLTLHYLGENQNNNKPNQNKNKDSTQSYPRGF